MLTVGQQAPSLDQAEFTDRYLIHHDKLVDLFFHITPNVGGQRCAFRLAVHKRTGELMLVLRRHDTTAYSGCWSVLREPEVYSFTQALDQFTPNPHYAQDELEWVRTSNVMVMSAPYSSTTRTSVGRVIGSIYSRHENAKRESRRASS